MVRLEEVFSCSYNLKNNLPLDELAKLITDYKNYLLNYHNPLTKEIILKNYNLPKNPTVKKRTEEYNNNKLKELDNFIQALVILEKLQALDALTRELKSHWLENPAVCSVMIEIINLAENGPGFKFFIPQQGYSLGIRFESNILNRTCALLRSFKTKDDYEYFAIRPLKKIADNRLSLTIVITSLAIIAITSALLSLITSTIGIVDISNSLIFTGLTSGLIFAICSYKLWSERAENQKQYKCLEDLVRILEQDRLQVSNLGFFHSKNDQIDNTIVSNQNTQLLENACIDDKQELNDENEVTDDQMLLSVFGQGSHTAAKFR